MKILLTRYVVKEWKQSYAVAFAAEAGESAVLSQEPVVGKEGEWGGWIWVMDKRGISGWVPEVFLVKEDIGYRALRDIDAIELNVHLGEEVTVSEEEAGWAWCITAEGAVGWVPTDCLSASQF